MLQAPQETTLTIALEMSRKKRTSSDFGARLVDARKARGMTQVQLATAIHSTQRAISSYENDVSYPPAPVLGEIARVLAVSTDELLGLKRPHATKPTEGPEVRRMWKKFRKILSLPERDQRAVTRLVSSLVAASESRTPPHSR